jgi:preprotein translocase subunit SecA
VDEADSVLIDEARTPLIISKQVPAPSNKYRAANTLADNLRPKVHYDIDMKNKNVVLNERGYKDCERALGVNSLFEEPSDATGAWAPFVLNAVKAKELFNRDVEYTVLPDGKGVGIIDSFTGRVLDGRRWSDGLHQSIEAKEGIEVSEQSKVIAKVTYQVSEGVGWEAAGGRGGGRGRKAIFTSPPLFFCIPLFLSRVHIRKRAIL